MKHRSAGLPDVQDFWVSRQHMESTVRRGMVLKSVERRSLHLALVVGWREGGRKMKAT